MELHFLKVRPQFCKLVLGMYGKFLVVFIILAVFQVPGLIWPNNCRKYKIFEWTSENRVDIIGYFRRATSYNKTSVHPVSGTK